MCRTSMKRYVPSTHSSVVAPCCFKTAMDARVISRRDPSKPSAKERTALRRLHCALEEASIARGTACPESDDMRAKALRVTEAHQCNGVERGVDSQSQKAGSKKAFTAKGATEGCAAAGSFREPFGWLHSANLRAACRPLASSSCFCEDRKSQSARRRVMGVPNAGCYGARIPQVHEGTGGRSQRLHALPALERRVSAVAEKQRWQLTSLPAAQYRQAALSASAATNGNTRSRGGWLARGPDGGGVRRGEGLLLRPHPAQAGGAAERARSCPHTVTGPALVAPPPPATQLCVSVVY